VHYFKLFLGWLSIKKRFKLFLLAVNSSYFALILTFFRAVATAMPLKKGFIMTKNLEFSLQNKKFKSLPKAKKEHSLFFCKFIISILITVQGFCWQVLLLRLPNC
jgi:hypothetical protein